MPVVEVEQASAAAGGAANTAANLAALGADVALVSVVGADSDGARLRRLLTERGVATDCMLVEAGRTTVAKRRILADGALVARYDTPPGPPLARTTRRALTGALAAALDRAAPERGTDAVVVCDYGLGTLTEEVRTALAALRPRLGTLLVDAHDLAGWAALAPDVVTPNAAEVATLLGIPLTQANRADTDRAAAAEARAGALRAASGATTVVVTLDRDGALLLPPPDVGPPHRTWARPAPESHACGAGDAFVAALALGLAARVPVATAVELAQAAADVVVRHRGTTVCSTRELTRALAGYHGAETSPGELARAVAEHRGAGRRIVFTNGCFDVVHRGHVAYLNQAKRLGDVLVVALNSDAGVRRLKGPGRPVNPLADRVAVIAALSCVDYVTSFDEATPANVLRELRPDVYAKGGDYTPDMLSETTVVEGYGGEVAILDYLPDRSTTAIVDRIRNSTA